MTLDAKRLLRNTNGAVTITTLQRRARAGEQAALRELARRVRSCEKRWLILHGLAAIEAIGTPAALRTAKRLRTEKT